MAFGNTKYPNLELMEYKFRQILNKNEKWISKIRAYKEKNPSTASARTKRITTADMIASMGMLFLCFIIQHSLDGSIQSSSGETTGKKREKLSAYLYSCRPDRRRA